MKLSKRANLDIDAQLYEAVEEGDFAGVQKFLKFGSDPNYVDQGGFSCLMAAVWYGFINIAKLLVDAGADVNFRYNGYALVHLAAASNDTPMLQLLLSSGANASDKTQDGLSILDIAKSQESHDIINFMSKYPVPDAPKQEPIKVEPENKELEFFKPKAPNCPNCGKEAPGYTCPDCGPIPFFANDKVAKRTSRLSKRS